MVVDPVQKSSHIVDDAFSAAVVGGILQRPEAIRLRSTTSLSEPDIRAASLVGRSAQI